MICIKRVIHAILNGSDQLVGPDGEVLSLQQRHHLLRRFLSEIVNTLGDKSLEEVASSCLAMRDKYGLNYVLYGLRKAVITRMSTNDRELLIQYLCNEVRAKKNKQDYFLILGTLEIFLTYTSLEGEATLNEVARSICSIALTGTEEEFENLVACLTSEKERQALLNAVNEHKKLLPKRQQTFDILIEKSKEQWALSLTK